MIDDHPTSSNRHGPDREARMSSHSRSESAPPTHPLHRSYKSIGEISRGAPEDDPVGRLGGGEYLRQRSLARRYGVSEVAVREALRHLEAEGLVETEPRRGPRQPARPREVTELWELRILIEKLLTLHAVPAIQPEDLARAEISSAP